ncbi:MAG: TonB family protein [Methylobacter sp.]
MKPYLVALLTGVVISLGLFWLMQIMLMSSQKSIKKVEPVSMMDFIRLKREPPEKPKLKKPPEKKVEQVQEKPQPPQRPKTPPKKQPVVQKTVAKQELPTPTVDAPKLDIPVSSPTSNAPAVNVAAPSLPPAPAKASAGNSAASSGVSTGVIPLERFPPKYPMRAAKRHIEGWVKIEFTITKDGAVTDAVVVEAEPAEIFDEAALQAISKWKFKGKIVDGVAVTQRAVQTLQFKLAK